MTDQSPPPYLEHNRINAQNHTPSALTDYSFIKRKTFQRDPLRKTSIILMALGVLAMAAPLVSPLLLEILIGSLLVAGGLIGIVTLSQYAFWPDFWSLLLSAVLMTVLAVIMIAFPLHGSYTFTKVLTVIFLVEGIAAVWFAFDFRRYSQSWHWILLNGFASLSSALILSYYWPNAPDWLIGTLKGLTLLLSGLLYITVVTGSPYADDLAPPST